MFGIHKIDIKQCVIIESDAGDQHANKLHVKNIDREKSHQFQFNIAGSARKGS